MAGEKKKSPAKKKKTPSATKPKTKKRGRGQPKKLTITPEILETIAAKATSIDLDERILKILKGLAEIDCTDYEIAAVLGVNKKTWQKFKNDDYPEIGEFVESCRVSGNISLRRTQKNVAKERIMNTCRECGKMRILDMAFEGAFLDTCPYCESPDIEHKHLPANTTMMVWLGKQTLGQSDKIDQKISGDADAPLLVSTLEEFVKHAAKKREEAAASRNSNSR